MSYVRIYTVEHIIDISFFLTEYNPDFACNERDGDIQQKFLNDSVRLR